MVTILRAHVLCLEMRKRLLRRDDFLSEKDFRHITRYVEGVMSEGELRRFARWIRNCKMARIELDLLQRFWDKKPASGQEFRRTREALRKVAGRVQRSESADTKA